MKKDKGGPLSYNLKFFPRISDRFKPNFNCDCCFDPLKKMLRIMIICRGLQKAIFQTQNNDIL
jgi:hypothetical protein